MAEPSIDQCELLCLDLPHAEQIRAGLPSFDEVEPLAAAARGLSDPTRLTIASALHRGDELCVCDVAWVVGQSQNLVSHHLRQLKIAGLVDVSPAGPDGDVSADRPRPVVNRVCPPTGKPQAGPGARSCLMRAAAPLPTESTTSWNRARRDCGTSANFNWQWWRRPFCSRAGLSIDLAIKPSA